MESVLPYVLAIVPTVGVGALFYFVIKSILEGDRRERLAQARWEAEHDGRGGNPGPSQSPAVPDGPRGEATTPHSPTAER